MTILEPLIRARYPDAAARLADLRRLADAAAAQPSLHDALAELTLDPPVSGSDLAGPPRLDEDYLTISTIHAAKGLEWPVVHVPHLVDGALPSDMALGDPDGLAEEHRLFYVALTRARDHLYLYAPLRLHHHRRGRDDRHGYGQLTRFLHRDALAACDNTAAAPPARCCRSSARSGSRWTPRSARCGTARRRAVRDGRTGPSTPLIFDIPSSHRGDGPGWPGARSAERCRGWTMPGRGWPGAVAGTRRRGVAL